MKLKPVCFKWKFVATLTFNQNPQSIQKHVLIPVEILLDLLKNNLSFFWND